MIEEHSRRLFTGTIKQILCSDIFFLAPSKTVLAVVSHLSCSFFQSILAHSFSLFLPVTSSLHSLGFSPQFLFSYPFSSMISLQLCSSSLQSLNSPTQQPRLFTHFQYLHPALLSPFAHSACLAPYLISLSLLPKVPQSHPLAPCYSQFLSGFLSIQFFPSAQILLTDITLFTVSTPPSPPIRFLSIVSLSH